MAARPRKPFSPASPIPPPVAGRTSRRARILGRRRGNGRRAPHFAGNLRAFRDPTPRFPDSVAHSQNGRLRSYVNLRPGRGPMPQILDRVGNPKIWWTRSYVNLQGSRHPAPHFLDSVGSSENRPSLSPGNGATFALKVPCFAVCFFAGSRLSRAAAPDLGESSIGVVGFGLPGGGRKVHGKTRDFCHFWR